MADRRTNDELEDAYLLARRQGLGSTDTAAILGLDPWKTELHVYLDKVGELRQQEPTDRMRYGTLLQPFVVQMYEAERRCRLTPYFRTIDRHRDHPWLTASKDALWERPGGKPLLVECKTAAVDNEWGEADTDEIPDQYLVQVQHQLEVLDLDEADVAVFFGTHQFAIYPVERNRAVGAKIIAAAAECWKRIELRCPPAPDWLHPSTPSLMETLHAVEPGRCVEFGEEELAKAKEYVRLGDREKVAKRERALVKSRLLHRMGNAQEAVLPGGYRLIRKAVSVPAHHVRDSAYVRFSVKSPGQRKEGDD